VSPDDIRLVQYVLAEGVVLGFCTWVACFVLAKKPIWGAFYLGFLAGSGMAFWIWVAMMLLIPTGRN
jgi:hypothetical protein